MNNYLKQAYRAFSDRYPRASATKNLERARQFLLTGPTQSPRPYPYSGGKPEPEAYGLRFVGFWDEVKEWPPAKHTGWYTDDFQSGTYRGVVFQTSADKKGSPRYLAGYYDDEGEQTYLEREIVAGGSEGAAQIADDLARIAAEEEREYQAEYQAAVSLSEEIEELRWSLEGQLDEISELFTLRAFPTVKRILRREIREARGAKQLLADKEREYQDKYQDKYPAADFLSSSVREISESRGSEQLLADKEGEPKEMGAPV